MGNKVAALTVAFNEPRLIGPCVRQFKKPYLEEDIFHMVLISEKPWRGTVPYDDGETFRAAMQADYIELKYWPNQAEQFNYGLNMLHKEGYEWAIICDADEYYTPLGIKVLLEDIESDITGQLRAPYMEVYWKMPIFRISNRQTDNPVVAIRTDQNFSNKRTPSLSEYGSTIAMLSHFSYVRNDKEMLKKIESFEHSDEFDRNAWYNNVWKKWIPSMKNLHPVVPEIFQMASYRPAPRPIIKNFYHKKEVTWGLN